MIGKEDLWPPGSDATVPTADLSDLKVLTASLSVESKLHPWQENLFKNLEQFKPGEMVIFSSGRNVGKSFYYEYASMQNKNFVVQDSATVDGEPWYTIRCLPHVGGWIRDNPDKNKWCDIGNHRWIELFDIHESILLQLNLKFS